MGGIGFVQGDLGDKRFYPLLCLYITINPSRLLYCKQVLFGNGPELIGRHPDGTLQTFYFKAVDKLLVGLNESRNIVISCLLAYIIGDVNGEKISVLDKLTDIVESDMVGIYMVAALPATALDGGIGLLPNIGR